MMVRDHENEEHQAENGRNRDRTTQAKVPTAAAMRALAEAEQRRLSAAETRPASKEIAGRDGPEPVRYGDWEVKGLATDF